MPRFKHHYSTNIVRSIFLCGTYNPGARIIQDEDK